VPLYGRKNPKLFFYLLKKIMKQIKLPVIFSLMAIVLTIAFFGCKKESGDPQLTSNAKPAPVLATPTVTCDGSTQVSLWLKVCAGASGTPAGFSVQWMTTQAYAANGNNWYLSDDTRLCKASFSGNANDSRYNLAAGACVSINIGELLFDNGTSTNCAGPLACGTSYVFRVFAHASSSFAKSALTPNLTCSTLDCDGGPLPGCTYTQGFWKTHGPIPAGNNLYIWPQAVKDNGLMLGTVTYTADQLLAILNTPAAGNGLLTLAHQLIAAKMNVGNGSADTDVAASITSADALIGALVIAPVGNGTLAASATSSLVIALTSYNEGLTGPGHCE
jgi:hypothetical protein